MDAETDWSQWSREATEMMQRLNKAWLSEYDLGGSQYHWDMNTAEIIFQNPNHIVRAGICVIGSTSLSEGSFLWSWANSSIPETAKSRIDEVRRFGQIHDLPLLYKPDWPGDKADGLEMLTVSSRILAAKGSWVEPLGDVTLFFALLNFRVFDGLVQSERT
jgi:Family of unknown function (DUF6882)